MTRLRVGLCADPLPGMWLTGQSWPAAMESGEGEIPKLVIPRLVLRTGSEKTSPPSGAFLYDSFRPRRPKDSTNAHHDARIPREDCLAAGSLLSALCQYFYRTLEEFVET